MENTYNYYNQDNLDTFDVAVIGSWLDTIGTATAAVGSTPLPALTETFLEDLIFIGNALQGVGSALVVESSRTLPNDKVGSSVQSIGNLTVLVGLMIENEKFFRLLNQQGNLIQAVGSGVSINYDGKLTTINNIGNGLQVIGNSLQALAFKNHLIDTKKGKLMDVSGGWIQTVGTLMSTLTVNRL